MARQHVCPWWGGYFIDNLFRRWIHNPQSILGSYVDSGSTVLDFGCGMGFFSIAMAKMVGENGKVIAADLQQEMLDVLWRRAQKAEVAERITPHLCNKESIGLDTPIDFALAFYAAHEAPDQRSLLEEIAALLRPGGHFLLVEPKGHVSRGDFQQVLDDAEQRRFQVTSHPTVRWSHAALLART